MITEWFFALPMDFKILAWAGTFSVAFVCFMFWGTFFLPRKVCAQCGSVDDPHEMFCEEEGLVCRKCRAEKIATSIVSGCEHCH